MKTFDKVVTLGCVAEDELKALRKIHHPNVLRLLSHSKKDGVTTFVFRRWHTDLEEWIHGRHLRGNTPVQCEILRQILLGLRAIHRARFVHCDVKPANVFLDPGTCRVVVGDLGNSIRWCPGKRCGIYTTADYQPPEVLDQDPDPDVDEVEQILTFKVDSYGFACVVYEIVAESRQSCGPRQKMPFGATHPFWPMYVDMIKDDPKARRSVHSALARYF